MRALVLLAKISAVLAGILLTFITVMTCASIVGRELFGSAITGDFELSGAATGAAIAMFMPWCQAKRGNIIVDFFTQSTSDGTRKILDAIGSLMLVLLYGLLAWRSSVGAFSVREAGETTMIIGLPMWWAYACLAPGLALAGWVSLIQVLTGASSPEQEVQA